MSSESSDSTAVRYGVNYFSTHNHYEPYYLSDEELNRDFGLFRDQGLEYVTLCAIWKYLEPEFGVYNEAAIDDLERVCVFAYQYNLKVIINFHTMMSNNSWTMPEWLSPRKFEAVFLNETAREAWLGFLDHVAERLDDQDSIWSWHMMNEPWRRAWACNVSIEEFLELWTEMKAVFKAYSDRPVSVRFTVQAFEDPNHFNRDPRIYSLFDYLALNYYEIYCPSENMTRVVSDAQQNGCKVVVSEFGSNATGDISQANDYRRILGLFNSLGLTDRIAWMWRADYDKGEPDLPGVKYNLAKDVDGTPREAFDLLVPRCPDVNQNGVVDVFDVFLIAKAWDFELGGPGYNSDADLNDDGLINAQDLDILNTRYGGP
jgi:endo-1,4-beta-mannosidase